MWTNNHVVALVVERVRGDAWGKKVSISSLVVGKVRIGERRKESMRCGGIKGW